MGLKKDSFYILLANIYSKGCAYVFFFLMAYLLGTEGFGVLRGTLPIMDTLTIFFCSGIPPAMAKFIAEDENFSLSKYIPTLKIMLLFSLFGGIFVLFLRYVLGGGYADIPTHVYYALSLALPFAAFISWSRGILQGTLHIKELSLTWVFEYTSKIIFSVVFAVMFGVFGAILSISTAYFIGGVSGMYFINKSLGIWQKSKFNKNFQFKILSYAVPIALGTASYRLMGDIDSIVIMSLLGAYSNGIYGYASLLSRGVFLFASSIAIPLLPRIAKTKDKKYIKKAVLLNILLSLPFVALCIAFPDELLYLFFHVKNPEASISLEILSISAMFMSIYSILSSALQGFGYAKISLYIILIGIVLNFSLNYILIGKFGIVGGAISTLISSFIILVIIIRAILSINT
ncbi:flippase [Methanotorris formicicus]|uniref:Polysaccharide biosynthesis protein n=1 Tax=Methanotorris formicicus Mc-S-70 TaxID=647171 RepID=H1KWC5_9EURY|nr:flippase [Methanotorris formicicus]EHP89502.1 polysaccharide biosynthesis protein [Methanotorris formicicus Mc-S-70]